MLPQGAAAWLESYFRFILFIYFFSQSSGFVELTAGETRFFVVLYAPGSGRWVNDAVSPLQQGAIAASSLTRLK